MAAALQCEICGGKLIGKPGGIFECDSCGMEYSTEWARAKIQEIRGTVKVEGTVEVTGKVQVEGPVKMEGPVRVEGPVKVEGKATADSLVRRGNMLLADRKWDEAKETFNKALEIEPENAEANLGAALAQYKKPYRESFAEDYINHSSYRWNINITTAKKHATGELKTWFAGLDTRAAAHDRAESNTKSRFSNYQKALTDALSSNPASLDSAFRFFTDNRSFFRCSEARALCDKKRGFANAAKEYNGRIKACGDELDRLSARQQALKAELSSLGLFGNREKKTSLRGELKTVDEQCALKSQELAALKEKTPKIDDIDRDLNALRVMAESNTYERRIVNSQIIELGRYPQGPNGEPAPIRWRVFKHIYPSSHKEEGAVLMCESVLDRLPDLSQKAAGRRIAYVLEEWLNSEFKTRAFTAVERSILYKLTVPEKDDETVCFFSPKSTAYARMRGVTCSAKNEPYWFLYSSGFLIGRGNTDFYYISYNDIPFYDPNKNDVVVGIRPVIHVKGMKP